MVRWQFLGRGLAASVAAAAAVGSIFGCGHVDGAAPEALAGRAGSGAGGAPDASGGTPPFADAGAAGDSLGGPEPLPPCGTSAPTPLDHLALARAAIALDQDRVYYVGVPQPGTPCPGVAEDCTSLLSLSKAGGSPLVHGAARFTDQIAVDDANVYWVDFSLMSAPKAGGEPREMLDVADGVIVTDEAVYTVTSDGGRRFVRALGGRQFEELSPLPLFETYAQTIVTDGAWAYLAPMASSPAPVQAISLSSGELKTLAVVDAPRHMAVRDRSLYVVGDGVMRVRLDDGTVTGLGLFGTSVTAIAVDERHLYLNVQSLNSNLEYSGQLVRMKPDASERCIVAEGLDYESTPALDDTAVYWVAGRLLLKSEK